ncbi:unnamed protein product [Gongylonema pulchrum]|uniref:FLYWCH-type domain-containing protein n=1 Tax=Gongylonema pulchrum TaxID=637853 RepID=A0A183EST7_9BILA|nr:unnamed protein product [Gongylonema pulchrum]
MLMNVNNEVKNSAHYNKMIVPSRTRQKHMACKISRQMCPYTDHDKISELSKNMVKCKSKTMVKDRVEKVPDCRKHFYEQKETGDLGHKHWH